MLGRARGWTTGTLTHSYNAAVMWPSKWFGASVIGCAPRQSSTGLDEVHIYSTGSCQVDWTFVIFTRLIHTSRLVSDEPASISAHLGVASSEMRTTLSVPIIYIAHNEGRVSYAVRIICESSCWSNRSGTLLNHDQRIALRQRAGQIGTQFAE